MPNFYESGKRPVKVYQLSDGRLEVASCLLTPSGARDCGEEQTDIPITLSDVRFWGKADVGLALIWTPYVLYIFHSKPILFNRLLR